MMTREWYLENYGKWKRHTPDSEIINLKSRCKLVMIKDMNHWFCKMRQTRLVGIIEMNDVSAIVADATGLMEGQWLLTTEVLLEELDFNW